MIKFIDDLLIIKLEKGEAKDTVLPPLVARLEEIAAENERLRRQLRQTENTQPFFIHFSDN